MIRVVIFGATGTVGAGALLECLDHPEISQVTCVVRRPTGREHPKLREVVHADLGDVSPIADELEDVDACFWCIGVPQAGHTEEQYTRITHDFTLAAARVLRERSPECCFVFVSGEGADETEKSRMMWARVKGRTENAVLAMGFARAVVLRPGSIATSRGIRHRVVAYRLGNILAPLLRPFGMGTSTEEIGRAMIAIALGRSVETPTPPRYASRQINELARLA